MKDDGYNHRDRCAITGIGATEFSKRSGRSVAALAAEAGLAAITDAGLTPTDIDGVVRSDYDTVHHSDIGQWLGLTNLTYWGATGTGGASPCGMVGQAVAAIMSGQANNVLVYRALNGRSGVRFGKGTAIQQAKGAQRVGGRGTLDEFFLPYGLMAPGQLYALYARRHMLQFGSTAEDLASIAIAVRRRANTNPAAMMSNRTMSITDYFQSRIIAEPLRLFDYCLESDGACAVVVTTAERATDSPQPTVLVRAVTQGTVPEVQGGKVFPALMRPDMLTNPSMSVARELYRRAGLGPAELDVAQLYDCFTITVLLQLEDYGFCAPGEGGAFASSGAIDLTGSIPINTAGGNLSEGYIHGMNHILEGVRQLRGHSTSQVAGAQTCLVTSGAPAMTSAMILRAA
ncbi:thiolase C-terminal domain-containing protein [Mycolicibacterium elephantis]|uniref:thiolase C-terminal domain-containing protein n=1 Tax=Mycolicibacterium elephantis TaxID=81858 RepID=UPI0007EAB982|nr:lipid-transfer protein [Mycolicibacterium elephantis]OBB27369.1 lipid-transfer protein [Mycolicibacterium elephantis]